MSNHRVHITVVVHSIAADFDALRYSRVTHVSSTHCGALLDSINDHVSASSSTVKSFLVG